MEVPQETPRQVPVRVGVLLRGTLQGAVHQAEGGQLAGTQRRGGAVTFRRSEPSVHTGAALWRGRRSFSSRWLRSSNTKSLSWSMCWRNSSTEVPPGGS